MRRESGLVSEYLALLVVLCISLALTLSELGRVFERQWERATISIASLGGEHATTGGPAQSTINPGTENCETSSSTCVAIEIP